MEDPPARKMNKIQEKRGHTGEEKKEKKSGKTEEINKSHCIPYVGITRIRFNGYFSGTMPPLQE